MSNVTTKQDPDRIARKLFIFTVLGACAFATIILTLMHFSNAELSAEAKPVTPIVQLPREH